MELLHATRAAGPAVCDAGNGLVAGRAARSARGACSMRHVEMCSWPQCNHSCPKLHNPFTGKHQFLSGVGYKYNRMISPLLDTRTVTLTTLREGEGALLARLSLVDAPDCYDVTRRACGDGARRPSCRPRSRRVPCRRIPPRHPPLPGCCHTLISADVLSSVEQPGLCLWHGLWHGLWPRAAGATRPDHTGPYRRPLKELSELSLTKSTDVFQGRRWTSSSFSSRLAWT